MLKRQIESKVHKYLSHGSFSVVIIGQRRVGKTFFLKSLMKKGDLYFDFENTADRSLFTPNVVQLQNVLGINNRKVVLDEIQYLDNAGTIIKLVHDHLPNITLLASGSASFLLMQQIGDSAFGRKVIFTMYPLSMRELASLEFGQYEGIGMFNEVREEAKIEALLQKVLLYGSLPEIILLDDPTMQQNVLKEYVSSLLYKDIFSIEGIRNSDKILKLTQLLALQVGSVVNPNELARQLEMTRDTVVRYIDLLEKFCIISVVRSFSRNPRKELTKQSKVYFSDLGILNAVINDFRPISMRDSRNIGGLFENLVYNTLKTQFSYHDTGHMISFWRDRNTYEVDFVITDSTTGKLTPIEVKWGEKVSLTRAFKSKYENEIDKYHCITSKNFWQYI